MKTLLRLALAGLLALAPMGASATTVVYSDPGGVIVDYIKKYSDMRDAGEKLVIAGPCASACTLFLGILPKQNYCMAKGARLGFHTATVRIVENGKERFEHATEFSALMWNIYPGNARRIIKRLGWNGNRPEVPHPNVVWAAGKTLRAMAPFCTAEDLR
ncbi:hypothetical protein I6F34_01095 [Bradyrhizobium sp. BRP05]|nr:hypothetical protein [Bradyrhizobium sp. BRP05]